jgi:hypothetical protein
MPPRCHRFYDPCFEVLEPFLSSVDNLHVVPPGKSLNGVQINSKCAFIIIALLEAELII